MDNQTLVALSPADLPTAQTALKDWCQAKIHAVRQELSELRENLTIAKRNKWKHSGLANQVARTEKRIHFYAKIKAAVEAGYLIVPNFPVEVFAVRVNREGPPTTSSTYRYSNNITNAKPQLLPAGEGRYVDDKQFTSDESHTEMVDGKEKRIAKFVSSGYDELDFPVRPVKPVVLEATERALGLRIFDRLGVVRQVKRDPIVVGQIIDPRRRDQFVTFFVAWWLDLDSL